MGRVLGNGETPLEYARRMFAVTPSTNSAWRYRGEAASAHEAEILSDAEYTAILDATKWWVER